MNTAFSVPVIDIEPLISQSANQQRVAEEIGLTCRETGFFYISGHGISEELQAKLEAVSTEFFSRPEKEKMNIRMELGGRAWRGYFPVGDELTSGKPDLKEGLYFGTELSKDHPKVQAGVLMHGRNLFPDDLPEMRDVVLAYMDALTGLGHHLMRGLSLSLGLEENYFHRHYTHDPLTLFRIFHYPPSRTPEEQQQWGVGTHTDYGVLTILKQDEVGGLQVSTASGWIDAPYIPGTFICNIGDMLEKITGGWYVSTPHRVLNTSGRGRFSFPFFFDPGFDVEVRPVKTPGEGTTSGSQNRWDQANVHEFTGTYGDYILGKVAKVFPDL